MRDVPQSTFGVFRWTLGRASAAATSTVFASLFVRVAFGCLLGPSASSAQTLLVPPGAVWKFLDNGSNQGTAWRATNFNDTAWAGGPAELGYGDAADGHPERTVVSYGTNASVKFITTYFRHAFVAAPATFTNLVLGVVRDDGAVVYLNGAEVWRNNMPAGSIGYTTAASTSVSGGDEAVFFRTNLNPSVIRAGTNVLAVEIHQNSASSSDISFDLFLAGQSGGSGAPNALAFFVAPNGSDSGSGSADQPFATLERARDAVRAYSQTGFLPPGGAVVEVAGGRYERASTLELTAADSGTASGAILWRAKAGEEVRIHGARQLQPEWFTAVSSSAPVWARLDAGARGHVMQVDLAAHGISDFGTLKQRSSGSSSTLSALELVFDGVPQELARWPDVGESGADATNGFVYTASPTTSNTFRFSGSRPARWGQAEELWFHGFWRELWYDQHIMAAAVDTNSRLVTLTVAPGYGLTNGMPYYAENLLEELTVPGEWYLNRASGILYFWPPAGPAGHDIQVSMLEAPLVRLTGVEYVTWQDITFEMSRGDLFAITGGDNNRVLHCTLRNAGNYAAKISGTRNGVSGCEIANTGDGGIRLSGGDRATLTGSGNFVRNCTIHGFGRWSWMYTPGVSGSGVGQLITHNLLYDSPHSAILPGTGNYSLIELNEIRDVCKWSSDAGAIYTGRDLGAHGTIIRNNFVHHIAGRFGAGYGTHGIYLDDCIAGIEVFGNICYKVSGMGLQHGGGRDDLMLNNLLVKCGKAMGSDTRGLTRDMRSTWDNLQALPYRGTIWSNAFPQLYAMPTNWATVTNSAWLAPRGTVFSRNLGYSNTVWTSGSSAIAYFAEVANNLTNSNPLFVDEAGLDLTLRPDSPAFTIPGFRDIPFHQIGPESDALKELAVWDFPTATDRAGFSAEALVTASALTVSGMAASAAPGHPTWAVSVSVADMNATNEAEAVAGGDYFETALVPLAHQNISLTTLSFDHRKSGGGADVTLFVRSGADGYSTTLGSVTTAGSNDWHTSTFTLSGVAKLQNRSAPMSLRIYGYRSSDDPGTQSVSLDTISVKGTVQTSGGSRVATVFLLE